MRKKLFVLCVIAFAAALLLTACAGADLTLTFEVEGQVYATVKTNGQETIQMPKEPRKKGYIFVGWYWDKDVWKKPFSSNSLLNAPITENGTVYAKWRIHEHKYFIKYSQAYHWQECYECGDVKEKEAHTYANKVCTVCGKDYGTKGLKYEKIEGGYEVTGIGTAAVTVIEIPSKYEGEPVIAIGDSAFSGFISLTSITIPDSVKSIGSNVFDRCSSLTSIAIGNGVTSIGSSAFSGCSSLTSIVIPNGVMRVNAQVFYECSSLTSIVIPNSVTSIGNEAFKFCSSLTSITIPNSVTSIGSYAFNGCSSLTSVIIPNSVTSIGSYAFNGCNSLTSILIPNGVTSISDYAFHKCSSLTSVAIPNSVTSIGDCAFYECDSLTIMEIPNSVMSIGKNAFFECGSLTIYTEVAAKPSGWASIDCPVVWNYKNNDIASDGYIYTIHNGLRYGFKDGEAEVVGQPRNIDKANIASEIIYKETLYSVTSISSYAFKYCSSLTSIEIPNSVTNIGDNAFDGCISLTSIALPNSVTSIGSDAFWRCIKLTNIKYQGTKAEWRAITKENYWNYNTGDYTVTCTDGTLGKWD